MKNTVQIIGGMYRGKKISFPDVEGLRPTPNRVRETLFNWLMQDIKNARCLDAFAGSGALGFEALSRGAAQVTLIEQAPEAYGHLQKILQQFNSSKLQLLKSDTLQYLQKPKEPFDIVFLDPPFDKPFIAPCLTLLADINNLKPGGLLYIESASPIEADPSVWELLKSKQAGLVYYGLFKRIS